MLYKELNIKWVDNTGAERYSTEIVLQNYNSALLMLDNSRSGAGDSFSSDSSSSNNNFNAEEIDDEIPF